MNVIVVLANTFLSYLSFQTHCFYFIYHTWSFFYWCWISLLLLQLKELSVWFDDFLGDLAWLWENNLLVVVKVVAEWPICILLNVVVILVSSMAPFGHFFDFLDAFPGFKVIFVGDELYYSVAFIVALVASRLILFARCLESSELHLLHFFSLSFLSSSSFFLKVFLFSLESFLFFLFPQESVLMLLLGFLFSELYLILDLYLLKLDSFKWLMDSFVIFTELQLLLKELFCSFFVLGCLVSILLSKCLLLSWLR